MKNQKGAALIVVLSLLTVSLMVGLSSMQSSQIDERLAGNYRAQSEAQMNAESLASLVFDDIYGSSPSFGYVSKYVVKTAAEVDDAASSWENFESFVDSNSSSCMKNKTGGACWVKVDGAAEDYFFYDDHNIISFGLAGEGVAYGLPVAADLDYKDVGYKKTVTDVIDEIDNELINIVEDAIFTSSNNKQALDWQDKLFVNPDLFSSADEVKEFRDALYEISQSREDAPVSFFEAGSVKKEDITGASGGVVVIEGDDFSAPNNSDFSGVMVVFGNQFRITGGGQTKFDGAILHVPYTCDEGGCQYVTPEVDIRGGNGSYNANSVKGASDSITSGNDNDAEITGIEHWWQ
ncbi:pilus assembly PilX family protein [Halomonas marinisediminis]|uniref:Type 4 fimbrial biogenesis protein PilX N-terminal domain-containing protein n=1 Tax=Halomonas marinisediminis TaxID=2546095 RepID=A0ABY2D374_9GAMM|nr:pilus assembly PilX N-terminal domain-containing protein [Halomonas marinisediminis]TDA95466.1 hypothetical protein E0702_15450 [Halomonas marinisediminis]